MTLYKYIFAGLVKRVENLWNRLLGVEKRNLLRKAKGRVLEIGVGTGVNAKYYRKGINFIGLEPNPSMYKYLRKNTRANGLKVKIVTGFAEKIPLANNCVDTVVSTHVLCSVNNVDRVLSEIKRVLKHGGKFIFIEHVGAKNRLLRFVQNFANPVWAFLMDGCQVNRDLEESIRSKFKKVYVKRKYVRVPSRIIAPHILGIAKKQ